MVRFLDLKKITESFQPELGREVTRVIDSGWYVRGEETRRFENNYAAFTGSPHCVGVGNGFDALRLIFRAWLAEGSMQKGDEVLVPANTYIASILAVSENGLHPVPVEPDPKTFNLDPRNIEPKITPRTRAIMVVHLYGRNAFDPAVRRMAEKYRLKVIEDNAQAAGCFCRQRRTGSLGDAAAHSFFPSKNLGALGDGGAVTTPDAALADVIRTLGNYGSERKGLNRMQGVNSRLDDIQAAVLNLKLRRLDEDNERRRRAAAFYRSHITHPEIVLPEDARSPDGTSEHVWHLFVIRSRRRDELCDHLKLQGIETLIHYPVPPHLQKAYTAMNDMKFPITEQIHREVLSLPLHPLITPEELQQVADAVNAFPRG